MSTGSTIPHATSFPPPPRRTSKARLARRIARRSNDGRPAVPSLGPARVLALTIAALGLPVVIAAVVAATGRPSAAIALAAVSLLLLLPFAVATATRADDRRAAAEVASRGH